MPYIPCNLVCVALGATWQQVLAASHHALRPQPAAQHMPSCSLQLDDLGLAPDRISKVLKLCCQGVLCSNVWGWSQAAHTAAAGLLACFLAA